MNTNEISLQETNLGELFKTKLSIPDYQRVYCWKSKHVRQFWQSLTTHPKDLPLHLGTVILHKNEDSYDIIDGQQRLTTLTLFLEAMKYESTYLPLLGYRYESQWANNHIANTKHIAQQLAELEENTQEKIKAWLNNIRFSILTLKSNNLDLAYTFFTNQNSKGKTLSDYDLLKAHHLRYIREERQAEHAAKQWNRLNKNEEKLKRVLGQHLYRLRKWRRKHTFNENTRNRVRDEYVAAPFMPSIPPLVTYFDYNEKIQGGIYFFAYGEHFVDLFDIFDNLPVVKKLRYHLGWRSHGRYADLIESLLFCYYLKFGKQYLTEALYVISVTMAQHRYRISRAVTHRIFEYASQSELVMMIDQSSSPTFFLAEAKELHLLYGQKVERRVQQQFHQSLKKIFSDLREEVTDQQILNDINNEHY